MTDQVHVPVMVGPVLEGLALRPGSTVVDGTLGLAGHSLEIIKQIAPGGLLVGFDWDKEMLAVAKGRLAGVQGVDLELIHADYRAVPELLPDACARRGRAPLADAILLDLGLNNAQIEDPARGISFAQPGPLDMRMDRSSGEPASALLNRLAAPQIERLLRDYADERWAGPIARQIVERRRAQPLRTTEDLVACVLAAIPPAKREKRIHPATRTFQAVRIAVNRELDDLQGAIEAIGRCLAPEGRLVTLAYHSGEDRACKQAMRTLEGEGFEILYKKPLSPDEEEIRRNPKSRSAKMRAVRNPGETVS